MQTVTTEWLLSIESLKNVPPKQLQWLIDNSRHYGMSEGEFLFKNGLPSTGTHIIISGKIRVSLNQGNGIYNFGFIEAREITGYLPFSRGTISSVNGEIVDPIQVMTYPIERMKELIVNYYELTEALVRIMTSRVRNFTSIQQQNEKMMALGKLSAGLAHELNNPASAIVRSSKSLLKHLQLIPEAFKNVIAIKMNPEQVDKVNNKMFAVLGSREKRLLTLTQRTGLENDLIKCLEDYSIINSAEVGENFIESGFTCDDVREIATFVPLQELSPVLNWINSNLVTEKMVGDIKEASQRIENLVVAIKNFTHMDRGNDKEYIDLHSGIVNTLTILAHKIRKNNVEIVENYDTSLPAVKAFVGELNQVWTNLIDNALDAMEVNNKGHLLIRTKRDKEFVEVSVIDDGPGIPDEIKSRVFDPFFTTKEIGKGTGLGLDVVTRIVRQHGGSIKVNSVPGRTEFVVCFPIDG